MRSRWLPVSAAVLCTAHTACTNGGFASADNPTGTGPFDSHGNYVEAWADNPSQWQRGNTRPADAEPDRPPVEVAATSPAVASNATTTTVIHRKPSPAIAKVTAKPKPKPVPVKVKPKTTRHTVRKGDSLYAIAKRYGTSVGAVQKANKIRGTVIHPGQSLVIPR